MNEVLAIIVLAAAVGAGILLARSRQQNAALVWAYKPRCAVFRYMTLYVFAPDAGAALHAVKELGLLNDKASLSPVSPGTSIAISIGGRASLRQRAAQLAEGIEKPPVALHAWVES